MPTPSSAQWKPAAWPRRRVALWIGLLAYGGAIEILQSQVPGRSGEWADLLADVTAHALRHLQQHPQDAGLYHCAAAGATNWNEYAKFVIAQAQIAQPAIKIKANEIAPVPTGAFPTPAVRPHNSRLNTGKLQAAFGLQMPHWQAGVVRMLAEIL